MVVYGEAERPRILAVGFDRTHPFASVVERYAGSVRYRDEDFRIRYESWDAAIVLGNHTVIAEHFRVIQIGGSPVGGITQGAAYAPALTLGPSVGEEMEIPDQLDHDLRELVKQELIPVVNPRVDRSRISPTRLAEGGANDAYLPLLLDLDGYAFAARYWPPLGVHECLYLPKNITNLAPWLLYAFSVWAEELPEIFPSQPEWTTNPRWMTTEELSAQSEVAKKHVEEQRLVAEQRALVADAEASLTQLRESVDGSERQLLTGADDPLAEIVEQTLRIILGFEVTNVDETLAEGEAKKEDLRVAEDGWISLCEVKGYSKGAKLSDLQKLAGYATIYAAERGQPPNAMWYIVNQLRGTDPTTRPQLLRGADDQVEVFGQQGGLAIDTRDLFRLRKAVASKSISAEAARAMLTSARGRFELPGDFGEEPPN